MKKTNITNAHKIKKNIKKANNFQKNNKKMAIFKQICQDFIDWICGVQEDEPLKNEAKNIYFLVEFKQNDFALSYSADEKFLSILDYGAYFPQEAEYLYSSTLKSLSKKVFQQKTLSRRYVLIMLKSVVKSCLFKIDFFQNHNVFFGLRLSKSQAKNCLAHL